jgi:hypothetical protein
MVLALLPGTTAAQSAQPDAPTDATALAKATQNPVASLISLPFQFNFNTGGDLEDETFFNLNFQPVMPVRVTSNVNVIARTIVPISSAPGPGGTRFSGVGDIQEQLFFTPARAGAFVWGIGPVFSLPTATAVPFTTGTWAGGVGGVLVHNAGPFVLGGLVTQFWPLSDAGDEVETDLLVIQPFINYNFGGGWALSFAPLITANWNAPDDEQWTVPLGLGLTKTTVFNGRPMNVGFQYYNNVDRPEGSAGQQIRIVVALLYPERPRP